MTSSAAMQHSTDDAAGVMRLGIGLMSGTSMDGVDAAAIVSDGHGHVERLGGVTEPYDAAFREQLRAVLGRADRDAADILAVEQELTRRHIAAVDRLVDTLGLDRAKVDVIGFHGHTIHHDPANGITVQIGDAAMLAQETGCTVVADFRSADVAAGGQGAPLAPLYHQALTSHLPRPLAVVNIGGVGNITWLGADEDHVIAFDTGPGNALIDDWATTHTGQSCDLDGALAAVGKVDEALLARLMDHPYFSQPAPKSLDRKDFTGDLVTGLSVENGAATLTAFTAHSIAAALPHLPETPRQWLITGGGRHNPTLMAILADLLPSPIAPMEACGANGDTLEAECFAWLAMRSLDGLPLSVPSTTGCICNTVGGSVYYNIPH